MNNFGKLKKQIVEKITDLYKSDDKNEMKNIIKQLKENKDLREIYLFYEGFETLKINNKEKAVLYVDSVEKILKEKYQSIKPIVKKLEKVFSNVIVENDELYESIDILSEESTLNNIDKKISAKSFLIDFLLKDKSNDEKPTHLIENEALLLTVLTNNFNIEYNGELTEDQRKEFNEIMSLNENDLKLKINTLKEDIEQKIGVILTENVDETVKTKLGSVKEEMNNMGVSRFNYYRLKELNNSLD